MAAATNEAQGKEISAFQARASMATMVRGQDAQKASAKDAHQAY